MDDLKNHIKPFGFLKRTMPKDSMAPKYIKLDGTKVIEQESEYGLTVYEVSPDHLLISRTYNKKGQLFLDYARRVNLEIGHQYDEFGQKIYEFESYYDEKNVFVWKRETKFEYFDNGVVSREFSEKSNSQIKVEKLYDENGNLKVKIEHRGAVKTFFDKNNKPFKREIDRGSGGIITEEL